MWFCIMEITLRRSFTDFTLEAKNSERTANCFRKNSVIKVPYVFWVWALWNLSSLLWFAFFKVKLIVLLNQLFGSQIMLCKAYPYPTTHAQPYTENHKQSEHEPVRRDCQGCHLCFYIFKLWCELSSFMYGNLWQ